MFMLCMSKRLFTMDFTFLFVIIIFMIALALVDGLKCYDYFDSDGQDLLSSARIQTCNPDITECGITITFSGSKTTRSHHCAYSPRCYTTAHQSNSSYLNVQTCCHDDLCNNGTNPNFEENKEYCYSAGVEEGGNLHKLLARIDREDLGTFCDANQSACQIQERKVLESNGKWKDKDWTGCASSHKCAPHTLQLKDHRLNVTCCNGHLCNGANQTGGLKVDPLKSYCYKYGCHSDRPDYCTLDILYDAVKQDVVGVCPMSDKGCHFLQYYGTNASEYGFVTGCFEDGYLNRTTCTPEVSKDVNFTTVWQCCESDRCNNIIAREDDTRRDQCYSVSCAGEGCLEAAIETGKYFLCDKSSFGCETGLLKHAMDNIYTIGCSKTECYEGRENQDGMKITGCCGGDRCFPVKTTSSGPTHKISRILIFMTCLCFMEMFSNKMFEA